MTEKGESFVIDYGKQALKLVQRIRPILAGQHPSVQGVTLAELTATWLSGHIVLGDPHQTQELQSRLLEEQVKWIRGLLQSHGDHAE
jgi:hypothetical protein